MAIVKRPTRDDLTKGLMSDEDVKKKALGWRGSILRGDVTIAYAIQQCVGEITYPYADALTWARVHNLVTKTLGGVA